MQRRLMVLLTVFVLLSLWLAPAGMAQAQTETAGALPDCPPYELNHLKGNAFLHSHTAACLKAYRDGEQENTIEALGDAEPLATGGPDGFGYTYNNAAVYTWISATTNSGVIGDDVSSGPINIGFDFPFYGIPQSQLYFNTNGLITFGSGSSTWGGFDIPNGLNPNNYIAPFWDDLVVGSTYNSGAIYYSQGGNAPNRYFLVEWRNVENYDGVGAFSFETFLYENGDIVVEHQSLPSAYYSTVGLENSIGSQGLKYQFGRTGLTAMRAIRFYYPSTPAARLLAYAPQPGKFTQPGAETEFTIKLTNTGTLGADTYDIDSSPSLWPVAYYASDGVTLLTDTDGDVYRDTGPISQGSSIDIIARIATPGDAQVGSKNLEYMKLTSSLNAAKSVTISLSASVPSSFAHVFQAGTDGAMSFMLANPSDTTTSKVTADSRYGNDVATTRLLNGNYLYAWYTGYSNGTYYVRDIEYTLLGSDGSIILSATKLTDNSAATMNVSDRSPSVAMAPNGTIGVAWSHYVYNPSTSKYNYNIYFATLSSTGSLLTGPASITNNSVWGSTNSLNIPEYYSPTIAATDDNRFIIGWEEDREVSASTYTYNVWYAVRATTGLAALGPTALTSNGMSWGSVLNTLTNGRVIMTWLTDVGGPYYAVLNSNGGLIKAATSLNAGTMYWSPDAVQLPNGKVAVAWGTGTGVQVGILNSSYALTAVPSAAQNPSPDLSSTDGLSLSADADSHVIMTWIDGDNYNKQIYALADSTGAFLTPPMYYNVSGDYVGVSWNGQGNAPTAPLNLIDVKAAGVFKGSYALDWSDSWRQSYDSLNSGPLIVQSRNGERIVASERVAYSPDDGATWISHSELMGMPISQLTTSYVFPWYNNVDLNTQLRFGNAGTSNTTVTVTVGGQVQGTYPLAPNASQRVSYNLNAGPVKVTSSGNVPIIASMRIAYFDGTSWTSFSEMMGLPASKLTTSYVFPWYNNTLLNTQLRFGNVGTAPTTVTVTIGGTVRGTYNLPPNQSTRVNYASVDSGPVKITSSGGVPIIASERVAYFDTGIGKWTEFSEMMGMPSSSLSTHYSFPIFDNLNLNSQLRVGNVGTASTSVVVTIGGVVKGIYPVAPNQSLRLNYAGLDDGPIVIQSSGGVPIIASERVAYTPDAGATWTSFSEMMGLPKEQLSSTYIFPWYNNADLDTQIRFGVP